MLAKSNKPYVFTETQAKELERTSCSLRKLNHDSMRELQRLSLPGLNNTQYRAAGNSFEILAPQVMFLLQLRDDILCSAREDRIDRIILHINVICNDCRLNESQLATLEAPLFDHSRDAMKHDPAHTAEIEMLLLLGQETGERLLARRMLPTSRRVVMTGLKRLMNALLKQRRHLQKALDPPEGLIEVRMGGDACCVCQKLRETHKPGQGAIADIA